MLTGHVPFDSEEPLQIMYKHVHEPVPEIERAVSNEIIPDELIKFLHKCLEKDPLKRISSVDAAIPVLEWIIARENLPKIQSEIETQPEKIEVKPKIPEARRPVTLSEIDTVLTPKYEDKMEEKYAETPFEAVSRRSFIKFSPYHYVFGSMVLFILIAGVYFYLKDTDNIKTEGGALPVGDAGIYAIDLTDVYEIENTDLLTQAPDSIEITSADQALGLFQDSIPDGVPENKFRTSLKTSAALKTENVFSKSAHIPEKKPAEHKTTLIKDQKTKPRIIDRKETKKEDFGEEW
jgi:serine/threonine protein kinase